MHSMVFATILMILFSLFATSSRADDRPLIEQALDEPGRITLDNIRLADAIRKVSEQTGVSIVMPESAMRLTPQGPNTVIKKVDIARLPLREGLQKLLTPIGMTFAVRDDRVEVIPKPALLCLGRPATWKELEALTEIAAMEPATDPASLAKLQARVQFQTPTPDGWRALSEAIKNVGAGPGDEVLSIACNSLGWGWCLKDRQIVVAPLEVQFGERLRMPVSLRMNNRKLIDVVNAVGDQSGVRMQFEPGALAAVPMQLQNLFTINVQNEPAQKVLDTIAANAGLWYSINPEGVTFYRPNSGGITRVNFPPDAASPPNPGQADPYVAKVVIPLSDGRTVEWLIRRSELPEDLRRMRQHDLDDFIEQMRQRAGTANKQ